MRTVGLVLALALVGCGGDDGGKGRDAGDDTPLDSGSGSNPGIDAPIDSAPMATGCTTTTPSSTFTNTICGPWGAANGAAAVVNDMNATLRIEPLTDQTSEGRCTSNAMLTIPDGGIFIEVPMPILATAGYAALRLGGLDVSINSRDNKLRLTNAAGTVTVTQIPFVAGAMRWWRLRPDRTSNEIVGEYSADATAWYEVGRVARTLTTMTPLEIAAGSENPTASVGNAVFDNLNLCP